MTSLREKWSEILEKAEENLRQAKVNWRISRRMIKLCNEELKKLPAEETKEEEAFAKGVTQGVGDTMLDTAGNKKNGK